MNSADATNVSQLEERTNTKMTEAQKEHVRALLVAGFRYCNKGGCTNIAFVNGRCGQHWGSTPRPAATEAA